MDFLNKIWDAIPDAAKAVVIQVCMVGVYTFVFVFLQTYTQNWQYAVALTAGFRAALIAIAQIFETAAAKPTGTNAPSVAVAEPKRKFSTFLP